MDSTLISVKSGKRFSTNYKDWKWWNYKVPEMLKKLHQDGFKVVIMTNQGGISKGKTKKSMIKRKIEDI